MYIIYDDSVSFFLAHPVYVAGSNKTLFPVLTSGCGQTCQVNLNITKP